MNPNNHQGKNLVHHRRKEFLVKEGSKVDDSQFNTNLHLQRTEAVLVLIKRHSYPVSKKRKK